ncbi:hypothetical protein Y032_0031g2329 [Ancylostoma ceylanicum]|uniref:Uncharacterized protein n=1 Tax=Ancylostoma ceylanicum TaxID=53326 RepID=A0A016UP76_9BILA|nr:hypothetical protein Y032_0031g2329 [Ancylostoma ceylanicum]
MSIPKLLRLKDRMCCTVDDKCSSFVAIPQPKEGNHQQRTVRFHYTIYGGTTGTSITPFTDWTRTPYTAVARQHQTSTALSHVA